jgi:WD40 repeat protein
LKTGKQKSSWSILDQNVLETPPGQGMRGFERLSTAAVSPDGKLIAFALLKDAREQNGPSNWFARIMLFETTTGKLQFQTDLGRDEFSQLAFSPNGKVLAAGGLWTANLWYTDTGKSVGVYEGHRGRITSLAFSPDGRQLASASEDSTVLIWNVAK